MALQLGALREALVEAGATTEKANRAAEEAAGYEGRFNTPETRTAVLVVMVAALYALLVPGAWLLLRVAYKVGALG